MCIRLTAMSVAVGDLPPLSGGHRLSELGGSGFVSHVNSNLDGEFSGGVYPLSVAVKP